jgi:AcrR family transcriptional regulator
LTKLFQASILNKDDCCVIFKSFGGKAMPKVDEIYFEQKRKLILDATYRVCMKKPLYEVTMRDIIEEIGISQGGIYRYYANFHDILFDLIDRETKDINLREKADVIFSSAMPPEEIVTQGISLILSGATGESDIGKILFELSMLFVKDSALYEKFSEEVSIVKDEEYLLSKASVYLIAKIEEGYFKPVAPLQDIFTLLMASVDGIQRDAILKNYYKLDKQSSPLPEFDTKILANILAKEVILALGGDLSKLTTGVIV